MRVIKDENGNLMVNLEAVLKRWKEYFEKLMNEENNREPRTEEAEVVKEEVNCVSREEVKNALRRMKKGKAVGPDELPVEVWKCMGVEFEFISPNKKFTKETKCKIKQFGMLVRSTEEPFGFLSQGAP